MKERPILFTTEMVQAILDGRKTQTRREFKLKHCNKKMTWANEPYSIVNDVNFKSQITGEIFIPKNVYGKVGDILWVRETWSINPFYDKDNNAKYLYAATDKPFENHKWKPSIHMPKEACRLRLKIKSIRVERLMDISEQDAIAEGVRQRFGGFINYANPSNLFTETYPFLGRKYSAAQMSYLSLWERINGENSFEENPWVWVIEFERA